MKYYVFDKKQEYYLESKDGKIISECRWKGYTVLDLLMTCLVFNYGFHALR